MPIIPVTTTNELSSKTVQFTITTGSGVVIPVADIDTAVFYLRDQYKESIINSRTAVDFKSSITSGGVATISLDTLDAPIVSASNRLMEETHVLTVIIVTNAPVLTLYEEIWLQILNLKTVE